MRLLLSAMLVCGAALSSSSALALNLKDYRLVWQDEFGGAFGTRPGPHWFFFDNWNNPNAPWRDAYYTQDNAFLDGQDHLVIQYRIIDGRLVTSYLQTYDWDRPESEWKTFGPGKGKYIEAKVDLGGLKARGPWVAFWLLDPHQPYDGNAANGTEIDIMEYVTAPVVWPSPPPWHWYGVANTWGTLQGQSASKIVDGRKDLRLADWHTFGLEWQERPKPLLIYYMDGKEVFRTDRGVSTSNGQALILSIEYDEGDGNAWGIDPTIRVYNDAKLLPSFFKLDYIRVYERK